MDKKEKQIELFTFPCFFNLEKVSERPTVGGAAAAARLAMMGLNLNDVLAGERHSGKLKVVLSWRKEVALREAAINSFFLHPTVKFVFLCHCRTKKGFRVTQ